MTQEEIIEGNKLINTFLMGELYDSGGVRYYEGEDGFQHESGTFLYYHYSWNWLMPVVEKITRETEVRASLQPDITRYVLKYIAAKQFAKSNNLAFIDIPFIAEENNYSFIKNTWRATVECIKWLNCDAEQKSSLLMQKLDKNEP